VISIGTVIYIYPEGVGLVKQKEAVVNVAGFHVRQEQVVPAEALILVHLPGIGEVVEVVVVVVRGDGDLMQVVLTAHAVGGLAHFLDRRQEEANQDGNDGNYHQQLDERESLRQTAHGIPEERCPWHKSSPTKSDEKMGSRHPIENSNRHRAECNKKNEILANFFCWPGN